jgi:hypothetical protein
MDVRCFDIRRCIATDRALLNFDKSRFFFWQLACYFGNQKVALAYDAAGRLRGRWPDRRFSSWHFLRIALLGVVLVILLRPIASLGKVPVRFDWNAEG